MHYEPDRRVGHEQARNLSFTGILERMRFLIHDRDSKFNASVDEVFRSESVKVIHTPSGRHRRMPTRSTSSGPSAPSVSTGCWSSADATSNGCSAPTPPATTPSGRTDRSISSRPAAMTHGKQAVADVIERRDLLGGLIHEYRARREPGFEPTIVA